MIKEAQLIHCDLKPENILLRETSGGTSASDLKIIDFGSACFEGHTTF
jgi:serine/threonine protein kinase